MSLARFVRRAATRLLRGPAESLPDDEYLRWLSFANAGMLHPGNVRCFEHALAALPSDAPLIEIGSFCGLSTNVLVHLLRKSGRPNALITCDPWIFEGAQGDATISGSPVRHSDYRTFVRESFLRNVRFFSGDRLPFSIERTASDLFAAWRRGEAVTDVFGRNVTLGGPIAFAYVDGDHRYDAARLDFENCDAHLVPGGFLLFDDSADGSDWEVNRLAREVQRSQRYELVLRNPNYFFRKR